MGNVNHLFAEKNISVDYKRALYGTICKCFPLFSFVFHSCLKLPKGYHTGCGLLYGFVHGGKKHKIWPCKKGEYSKHGAKIDVHRIEVTTNFIIVTVHRTFRFFRCTPHLSIRSVPKSPSALGVLGVPAAVGTKIRNRKPRVDVACATRKR